MSKPDIKIKKLSLAYFRGAKELVELDLGSEFKSAAIFGYNGEGKSTFAQGIEWFYRERIDALSGEGVDKEDIVNLAATKSDETSVEIVFNKKELNASKIYLKDKIKCSNSSSDFTDYIANKSYYDRLYLNQQSILWLLKMSKGEKRVQIAKIIGYEDIVTVRTTIGSVLRDLEKSSELADIKQRIANNDGIMTKGIYGEAISDISKLLEKSSIFLKVLGVEDSIHSIQELESAIEKAIRFVPNEEKAKRRVELENLKIRIPSFETKLPFLKSIEAWENKYNSIVSDKESLSKLTLSDFLKMAEKIIADDKDLKICPLCEQKIVDRDKLLKNIIERFKKYSDLRMQLNTLGMELSALISNISDLQREFSEIIKLITDIKLQVDDGIIESANKFISDLPIYLKRQYDSREKSMTDKAGIDSNSKNVKNQFGSIVSEITGQIEKLAVTQDEKEKQDAFQKLIRGKDIVNENLAYRKQVKAYEDQIRGMRYIDGQMLDLQNNTLKEVLKVLSEDVNHFFCFLNRKDKVKNVRLELKGEEGIEFNLDFYGHNASPPKKYLSESQMNSLGIALFLAAVKKFNKANKFFVLDDVLISFDRQYRLRLLDLLEEQFSDYQIILLTHENYWYQIIRRKFPNWILREVTWSFDNGIRFKDEHSDWIESIRAKLKKGEKIGNELRSNVEGLLKEICENLEVRLPFRMGDDNERRTIGELFPYLTSTLQAKKSALKDTPHYKALEVSNFIVTCSSHNNPDLDSSGDLEDTIDKIKQFRDLFVCGKGEGAKKSVKIPGQDKISCKCGSLLIDWKD